MPEQLFFEGLRFPAARVAGRSDTIFRFDDGLQSVPAYVLDRGSKGRSFRVERPEGWWRDFADLSLTHEPQVLSFVQRRGDPFGQLAKDQRALTSEWVGLRSHLQLAAQAWTPRERGDCEVSAFRNREAAAAFGAQLPNGWANDLTPSFTRDLEQVLTAKSLAAYMIAAAIAALRAQRPMRRCRYCTSWFNVHRPEAEFCSASCRAAIGNGRISPHGIGRESDHEERDDAMAGPLARAGIGRDAGDPKDELRHSEGSESPRSEDGRGARAPRRRRSE